MPPLEWPGLFPNRLKKHWRTPSSEARMWMKFRLSKVSRLAGKMRRHADGRPFLQRSYSFRFWLPTGAALLARLGSCARHIPRPNFRCEASHWAAQ